MMPLPMVGRAEELAELSHTWSRLSHPSRRPAAGPRTAVITGAAGSGKSLLVQTAIDAADPPPAVVLSGRARIHTPAPYDWLAGVLSAHGTDGLGVPADALAWLAQRPDAPARRYAPGALLRLAVHTVRTLTGPGPAAIVVEDLHALDPASLNLVAELAAAPGLPALLLVTSRPTDEGVSPQLAARTLAQLAGTPGAVRQHLGALAEDEVAKLLAHAYGTPAPREVTRAVHRRTRGNPYRLTELFAEARGAGIERLAREVSPVELTAREMEVLSCVATGMSNKQVASALGISIRTVTVHVSNLLRKTRSSSRTEAALWAVRHRVFRP